MSPVRRLPVFSDEQKSLKETLEPKKTTETLECKVKVITPIFGGGAEAAQSDPEDIIRAASIRGHLRFWWRALYGPTFETIHEMYQKETEIWGGTQWVDSEDDDKKKSRVSLITVRVGDVASGESIPFSGSHLTFSQEYAAFPARKQTDVPERNLRFNVEFKLNLTFPQNLKDQVANTLRTWVTFGGYGARTRRGMGDMEFLEKPKVSWEATKENEWVWNPPDFKSIESWFKNWKTGSVKNEKWEFPVLNDASIGLLPSQRDEMKAWDAILAKYVAFRQQRTTPPRKLCKEQDNRPNVGRSFWPEPDKIRHITNQIPTSPYPHTPNFNNTPYYPRAQFGLPINFHFQQMSRCFELDSRGEKIPKKNRRGEPIPGKFKKTFFSPEEPSDVQLTWKKRNEAKPCDRWASPLVLGVIRCQNGECVPYALWMNSPYPDGEVVLTKKQNVLPKSSSEFTTVHDPSEIVTSNPVAGKLCVSEAFFEKLPQNNVFNICTNGKEVTL